jgi:hypothetical protein
MLRKIFFKKYKNTNKLERYTASNVLQLLKTNITKTVTDRNKNIQTNEIVK